METNQQYQERLNTLASKLQYLKAETLRIEKEKKAINDQLLAEAIKSPEELAAVIATRQAQLLELKTKFEIALVKIEKETLEAEEKLK